MELTWVIQRIGKLRGCYKSGSGCARLQKTAAAYSAFGWILFSSFFCSGLALAASEPKLTVDVDRRQISQDESVALSFSISASGAVRIEEIQYHAPDFSQVNEYNSTFLKSEYDSVTAHFGTTHTQKITRVLRPRRVGTLRIQGISAVVDGQTLKASDIVVDVSPAGSGTPPPRGYGGGAGLRAVEKRSTRAAILLRAEVDKNRAYKGEQVVVSYYLYRRARVFNIQVDKFPELKGFLREELEMPVMGQRLDTERVLLDGVPYDRSLLIRYAVYPLQEGKLKVDPLGLKYHAYSEGAGMEDGEDPLLNFFQQFSPRQGVARSEPVTIEVESLPADGRPASFTGGVGDFNVTSAVDKYEVNANEALTLTVKVEGRGNLAAIGEPKVSWPNGVEYYDSKGQTKGGRGGVGEKIFEILLIPRVPGKVTLPALEFGFFDPEKKTYVTRSTDPIDVQVLSGRGAPAPTAGAPSSSAASNGGGTPGPKVSEVGIRPLKSLEGVGSGQLLEYLYWVVLAVAGVGIVFFAGTMLRDLFIGRRKKSARRGGKAEGDWKEWAQAFESLRTASGDLSLAYERLSGILFDALDRVYGVGARSMPRAELGKLLIAEKGMVEALWGRVSKILEASEAARFSGQFGNGRGSEAHAEFLKWVNEAESVSRVMLGR